MFKKLRDALFGQPFERVPELHHERLGSLHLNDDGEFWETQARIDSAPFAFQIGGDERPDPALIDHAVDIMENIDDFRDLVSSFLAAEAQRMPECADEIAQLDIEAVCLWWPDRPTDGMIFFSGGDQDRLWRCDYLDRKPTGLGFDS